MFKEEMKGARIIQYQSSNPASLGVEEGSTAGLKEPQNPKNIKDFILLEGANGSGKSTLAKLLKINMVGWSVKTLDYKDAVHFMKYLQAYSLNKETIFDRGHLS